MSDRYSGWQNWETWVANLWFDNYFIDDAANMYAMAEDESEAIVLLESYIEEVIRESLEENTPSTGLLADIIGQALQAIDYREIAEYYISDVVAEEVYS